MVSNVSKGGKGKKTPRGKGRIVKRTNGNKTLRRISNSSFDVGKLTSDLISTPIMKKIIKPKKRKQSRIKNRKPKLNKSRKESNNDSTTEQNITCELAKTLTNKDLNNTSNIPLPPTPSPSKKQGRLPAGNQLIKSSMQLNDLFRNDFVCNKAVIQKNKRQIDKSAPVRLDKTVELTEEDDDIIILDDIDENAADDKDEKEETDDKTIIENVGEEMLKLVSDKEEGELTSSTIEDIETITIDDTIVAKNKSDSDIIIIHEDEATDESVQEIAARFFTTGASMDFIPINSGPQFPTLNVEINTKKGKKRRQVTNPAQQGPSQRQKNSNKPNKHRPPNQQDVVFLPSSYKPSVLNPPPPKGATIYSTEQQKKEGLRPIVIDGSNIGFSHGKSIKFSVKGIQIVIDYFMKRGHQTIVAFLPQFRLGSDQAERNILEDLEKKGQVVFTPSRKFGNKAISSYDDRMILDFATEKQGIVVSRDNFRDIYEESSQHRETIEKRILMPTFVGDTLMFPDDPLGRNGPRLDKFLRF